jgi:hypothetical protein
MCRNRSLADGLLLGIVEENKEEGAWLSESVLLGGIVLRWFPLSLFPIMMGIVEQPKTLVLSLSRLETASLFSVDTYNKWATSLKACFVGCVTFGTRPIPRRRRSCNCCSDKYFCRRMDILGTSIHEFIRISVVWSPFLFET